MSGRKGEPGQGVGLAQDSSSSLSADLPGHLQDALQDFLVPLNGGSSSQVSCSSLAFIHLLPSDKLSLSICAVGPMPQAEALEGLLGNPVGQRLQEAW